MNNEEYIVILKYTVMDVFDEIRVIGTSDTLEGAMRITDDWVKAHNGKYHDSDHLGPAFHMFIGWYEGTDNEWCREVEYKDNENDLYTDYFVIQKIPYNGSLKKEYQDDDE